MRKPSATLSRRRFLRGLGALAGGAVLPRRALAAPRDVVVLTAYPDEVVSRFEAAFEQAYPQYRLRLVWRMPHDALPYLQQPQQGGVDVYWSASPRTYAQLKREHAWRRLDIDRGGLPGKIGNTVIDDADGYYLATEVAGYGFAVNPDYLRRHALPAPADWDDLAQPRYAGHIALPSPSQVGFAPVMVDIPLQAYGWQRGWATWSAIAANAELMGHGATFVTDEVGSGRRGIGLTIDFFAAAAIANGAPLQLIYPRHGGVNPGQIAVTAGSANPEGARAFVAFVLSAAGQKILTHPDIRKLPVRPAVYAGLPADYHNPFAAAARGGYDYDNAEGRPRLPVIAAAFGQGLEQPHQRAAALWQRARAKNHAEALALLGAPPLAESEAADGALQRAFARRATDAPAKARAAAAEQAWARAAAARLDRAAALLTG